MHPSTVASDADHFWVRVLLCSIVARRELEALGYDLNIDFTSLPILTIIVGLFTFPLTSERWVEALHASNKHVVIAAHRVGPVHIAFHAGLKNLNEAINQSPHKLEVLAEQCLQTRNPVECLDKMKLKQHASVQTILSSCLRGRFV